MSGERRLDLAGFDAEPADLDLVVGAANELDAAVGQVAYAVAGAVQAPVGRSERIRNKAFGGKVGAAEVATRHALPADMQFAYDSRRYRFPAGVQDVDAGVGDRAPARERSRARRHVVDAMGADRTRVVSGKSVSFS